MSWNDDWRNELEVKNNGCYERLCECRNTFNDVKIISKLMLKYNPDKDASVCLERVTEWICDWNNQFSLFDKIDAEYNNLLMYLQKGV